jgi:flagellar biosynthesis/type III secretory pathway M-ring protein FliF/YscJ
VGGYELLDSLTGFGTTSQMFDAAYWRAKEGELARTILAVPEVKTARVHISQAPGSPLRRAERPTASVTVSTSAGTLDESQARALKHLVASAVAGMRPEDVQIIDTVGGLIAGGDEDPDAGIAASDRAEEIRRNVQRLLEARVGAGKAVVEVSLDTRHRARADHRAAVRPEGTGRHLDRNRGAQRQRHQARRRCDRGLEPARGRCRAAAARARARIQRNPRAGELRGLGNQRESCAIRAPCGG